jgi:hypothetical protein
MLQGQAHLVNFFSDHSPYTHFPDLWMIMYYAVCYTIGTPGAVTTLSVSSCQLEWTLPPSAQMLLSQSQQGNLVRLHLWLSSVLQRISQPSCELLYTTNTTVNRKHFFMNILCIEPFCPQKCTTECCCMVVHSSSTVATFTTDTNLWTCACMSAT